MSKFFCTAVIIAAISPAPLWAQQGTPSTPTNPTSTPSTSRPRPEPPRLRQNRLLHLSGQVVLDVGTPPPEPVFVDLLCSGQVIRQTMTKTDGRFNFTLGDTNHFDSVSASVQGNVPGVNNTSSSTFGRSDEEAPLPGGIRSAGNGRFDMNHCSIRLAPTPGFRANDISLGFRSIFDNPELGLIVMHRMGERAGTLVSMNDLQAPKKARKAYEKGHKELFQRNKPNLNKAAKKFEEALSLYPEYAAAWQHLGIVLMRQEKEEEARDAFNKSSAADPNYLPPLLSLARIELGKGAWKEASAICERLLELDSSLPESRYYSGLANYYLARYDTAFESLNMLSEGGYSKQYPAIHFMLGDLFARKGELGNAASELRIYLNSGSAPQGLADQVEQQLLKWEQQGLIPKVSGSGSDGS
ncbi:MAG TPA: tetratricopeptide repeat protein [Acidobacteriota bacterium]|nr:tetratricopeptide repeat protein [Acidobacteriota bacterium]